LTSRSAVLIPPLEKEKVEGVKERKRKGANKWIQAPASNGPNSTLLPKPRCERETGGNPGKKTSNKNIKKGKRPESTWCRTLTNHKSGEEQKEQKKKGRDPDVAPISVLSFRPREKSFTGRGTRRGRPNKRKPL